MRKLFQILACLTIGYGLGCINPAFIAGKRRGYDVRESGSRNAGASNTVLMAGKLTGFFVAMADILKAWLSWKLCRRFFPMMKLAGILGGTSCILGHMYPAPLGFKGGKGLACLGGVALAYNPRTFFIMLAMAIIIGLTSKYIAIVTVTMSVVFPIYHGLESGFWLGSLVLLIPAIPIFIKHLENFRRIKEGKEVRLSYIWDKEGEEKRLGVEE